MKITSVLLVESIEKSLPFWIGRMGWQKTVEVPDGGQLGFVILVREGAEVMLQTIRSARQDEPKFVDGPGSYRSSLFIEVEDWPDILERLQGYEITMPERDTFYGMREVGVFEPNGHVIVFAAWLKKTCFNMAFHATSEDQVRVIVDLARRAPPSPRKRPSLPSRRPGTL